MTADERIAVLERRVAELERAHEAFRQALDSMHAQQQKFYASLQALKIGRAHV